MESSRISTLFSIRSSIKTRSLSSLASSSSSSSSSHRSLFGVPSSNLFSLSRNKDSIKLVSIGIRKRDFCVVSESNTNEFRSKTSPQVSESFFRSILASMEKVYLSRNPTASAVLKLVGSFDAAPICYDHLAFRSFGVDGYGIDSLAQIFLDSGFTRQEELRFPAKKLKAFWFAPPSYNSAGSGGGVNGPFPRVFISELLVDEISPRAQETIRKYANKSRCGGKHAALASALGSLTWERPLYSEFQELARTLFFDIQLYADGLSKKTCFLFAPFWCPLERESEYAAWTLVNGYALNHVTISAHRLESHLKDIKSLNQFVEKSGFKLNSEGGVLKVSPDGLLLQSSTVADSIPFDFADGITESVPCAYIEFAERLVLPQYKSLPENEIQEIHRRDGFEVGNADKIFESTSKDQLTRKAA